MSVWRCTLALACLSGCTLALACLSGCTLVLACLSDCTSALACLSICTLTLACLMTLYLSGGVVEHLLPGGVQGVPVGQQPLLRHVDHLPGRRVHGHRPLVPQGCLLGLLLGLGRG